MKCKAWIRHFYTSSYPELLYCDKALDHTGDHRNEDNALVWSQ